MDQKHQGGSRMIFTRRQLGTKMLGRTFFTLWFVCGFGGFALAQDEAATPLKQTEAVPANEGPSAEIKIFEIHHSSASEIVKIIRTLIGESNNNFFVECDPRMNCVVARGTPAELDEIRNLLLKLDTKVERKKVLIELSPVEESVSDLRDEYASCEDKAMQIAAKFRGSKTFETKRDELIQAVKKSFEARQALQKAEIYEYAKRIQDMQRAVDSRQLWSEKIVERRVDELLDPSLNWNVSKEPIASTSEPAGLETKEKDFSQEKLYSGLPLSKWLEGLENCIGKREEEMLRLAAINSLNDDPQSDLPIRKKMEELFVTTQREVNPYHISGVASTIASMAGKRNQKEALDYAFRISDRLPMESSYEIFKNLYRDSFKGVEVEKRIAELLRKGSPRERALALLYLEQPPQSYPGQPVVRELDKEVWSDAIREASKSEDPSIRMRAIGQFKVNAEEFKDRLIEMACDDPSNEIQRSVFRMWLELERESPSILLKSKLKELAKSDDIERMYIAVNCLVWMHGDDQLDMMFELLSVSTWGIEKTDGNEFSPRELLILNFKRTESRIEEIIEVLQNEKDPETRKIAIKTIDWLKWFDPEKPVSELNGRWKVLSVRQVDRPGHMGNVPIPLGLKVGDVIEINRTTLKVNNQFDVDVSQVTDSKTPAIRIFKKWDDSRCLRCGGEYEIEDNELRLRLSTQNFSGLVHSFVFVRVDE